MTEADRARFAFYVEHVAPYLAILAEAASSMGMPFASAVQWAPGHIETVVHVPASADMDADATATMAFATGVARAIYRPLWVRMAADGHPEPLAAHDEGRPHVH